MDDLAKKLVKDLHKIKGEQIKKGLDANRYKALNLKFNPFPVAAIAKYTHLPPLNEETIKKIETFITQTYRKAENEEQGDYAGLAIVGEYGYGKTHLMKYIENLIISLDDDAKLDFQAKVVYIDRPEDSPRQIVHKIIEDLEPDNLRRYIWNIVLTKIFKNEDSFEGYFKKTLADANRNRLLEEPIKSNPIIFYSKFKTFGGDVRQLQDDTREVIKKEITSNDTSLADRYLDLLFPEKKAHTSWDVLTGYVNARDMQKKEVSFLNSVVKILRNNEVKMLYVFIDEFEFLPKMNKKMADYINALTTMINRQRKWAIVISITRDALEQIKAEYTPLYDRLTTVMLKLEPLNIDSAKELLKNYLNLAKIKESDDLTPFQNDEVIQTMINLTKGNQRSFIKLSNQWINHIVDHPSQNTPEYLANLI